MATVYERLIGANLGEDGVRIPRDPFLADFLNYSENVTGAGQAATQSSMEAKYGLAPTDFDPGTLIATLDGHVQYITGQSTQQRVARHAVVASVGILLGNQEWLIQEGNTPQTEAQFLVDVDLWAKYYG